MLSAFANPQNTLPVSFRSSLFCVFLCLCCIHTPFPSPCVNCRGIYAQNSSQIACYKPWRFSQSESSCRAWLALHVIGWKCLCRHHCLLSSENWLDGRTEWCYGQYRTQMNVTMLTMKWTKQAMTFKAYGCLTCFLHFIFAMAWRRSLISSS